MTVQYSGVILAAGESTRFGGIKILTLWDGQPLIRYLCLHMLKSGLTPVRVVLGAYQEAPRYAVKDLSVECVVNPDWQTGMVSSLQAGLRGFKPVEGVVMTLGDHPYLPPRLIRELTLHVSGNEDVVIPQYKGISGHPVLWLANSFDVIFKLTKSQTLRDAHAQLKVKHLEWPVPFISEDIDTVSDFERIRNLPGFHESNSV